MYSISGSPAERPSHTAATKAKKEDAENARLEEERIKKEREETAGLAADRHKEYSEQLAAIRKALVSSLHSIPVKSKSS